MNINNLNYTNTSLYQTLPVLDGENGQAMANTPMENIYPNAQNYAVHSANVPSVYANQTIPVYYQPNGYANQSVAPLYANYAINPNLPVGYTSLGVQKTPYGDNIYLYQLKNGQKVAVMPKKGTTIVKTFVDSGSMNETDSKRGISHFIEHNLFNGSKNLAPGQFFSEVSKMGASTNASTDYAQTDYYIQSSLMNENDLIKTIKMHADMLTNPLFPNDMIEKEKGPVTSEISMVNDDIATQAANEVVRNLFQIQSDSDNLVAGSIGTVNALNRDDVVGYYGRHYTPDNMYTVVVGDVDPDKTIGLIAQNFNQPAVAESSSRRTTETLTPIQKPVRVDFKSPIDNCTTILAGFSGPLPNDLKENLATIALGNLLTGTSNSRLTRNLASLNSYADYDLQKIGLKKSDPQALFYQILAPKATEQDVLDVFYDTVSEIAAYPPTDAEMQVVKKNLNKMVASVFEDPVSICETIGGGFLDGNLNSISDYKNIINNLTRYDIQAAARKYMDLSKISLAVVHPGDVSNETILNNYSRSTYALNKIPKKQGAASISFGSNINAANSTKEAVLPDNTHVALNNSDSDICYMDWKLVSKASVPKNLSTSYVLKEILNNGTTYSSKQQFINRAESKGIDFSADANGMQIELNTTSMKEDALESINLMKEALYNPRFTRTDFEVAKQKIRSYCQSLSKDAGNNLLVKLYGDYFATPEQIVKGLDTLTLKEVKDHYYNIMANASSSFVASAPFDDNPSLENAMLTALNTEGIKYKTHAPKLDHVYVQNDIEKVLVDTEERNQAQIYKTYSFKMSGNIEDEVKFELLNTILGGSPSSRLFQDLREKQKLAYRVSSQIQSFEDTGIITFSILTTTDDKKQNDIKYDNLQKSLEGFKYHAKKLMDEPVTDEELDSAKMMLKQQIARQMELPGSKTALLAMNITQPYGIKRIDEYYRAIDKMTAKDIQDAARHVFVNKPVYSILASEDTINNQKDYLNSIGSVDYLNVKGNVNGISLAA